MTQKINNLITNYKRASTHARAHTYFNHIKKQVKFLKTLKDVAESFRVVSKETGLWTVTGAVRLNSAARRKRRYWRNGGKLKINDSIMDLVWSPRRLTALVFVCTVALAGLEAGLALPGSSSPVLRSVHALLELAAVAHVLLLQLVSPVARELVGVQDVQHGERSCPVPDGALESNKWEWFI